MLARAAAFIAIAAVFSCSDGDRARKALEDAGYINVTTTGWEAWACDKNDATCTGFTATGPTGRHVSGAVGCGAFSCSKGCTIRLK